MVLASGKSAELYLHPLHVIFLFLVLFSSCAGYPGKEGNSNGKAPKWIMHPLRNEDALCAVGVSEPTFYRRDARENAAEAARSELARTLRIEITSVMVDISSSNGSAVSETTVSSISVWAASTVMEGASIKEYWRDEEGIAGKQGFTYALVCMERKLSGFSK